MKFESILIVTYGRSGSTLLQGLLNSIDGVYVAGENENFLYGTFLAHEALLKAVRTYAGYGAAEPTGAWYGINDAKPRRFVRQLWSVVRNTLFGEVPAGTQCVGFKEIRYFQAVPLPQLHGYLDFLAQLFPNPAFVINLRNHDDVLQSGWWRKHTNPEALRKNLVAFEQSLEQWRLAHAERTCVVRYEDVINKGPTLMQLYEFLGAPFDEERYSAVLAQPHSYNLKSKPLGA